MFILRNTLAVSSLLPGIEMEDNHIKVGRDMSPPFPVFSRRATAQAGPIKSQKQWARAMLLLCRQLPGLIKNNFNSLNFGAEFA